MEPTALLALLSLICTVGSNVSPKDGFFTENDDVTLGHEVCAEGHVFRRKNGDLKCCVKMGSKLKCHVIQCEDEKNTVEFLKTEVDAPVRPGKICEDGLVFRGYNNKLYCCEGDDDSPQRLCARILCRPRAKPAPSREPFNRKRIAYQSIVWNTIRQNNEESSSHSSFFGYLH